MLFFSPKDQNSKEIFQGAKFSVQFFSGFWLVVCCCVCCFFFGLAFFCSGDTQLTHVHHISAAFRFYNTKSMVLKKKALSYKIRSISSVLLIKSYFNIKYSYSILYTSFSLLAEYCYWLVKQKNFNHFALRCFGGTIWFPAATLITVMGEKEKKREKQGGKCSKKSILGYKVGWMRGSFSECKDWSHSVEHETPHSLVFPLENSPSYTASHSRALFLPSMKPFPL